ncbi:MAG: cytochrome b/b6 domain-containing protein [Peptococcaceae bacterium]|nr:cytochrome b/b6 domain-containing protein [Peptococcaceae bacterium]
MAQQTTTKTAPMPNFIERFDKHQRYQHILLIVSIFFLCLTGFPIKYADAAWARAIVAMFQGFDHMFTVHLVSAVCMILSGIYHIVWIVLHFKNHGPKWAMLPSFKDFKDAWHHGLYLIGVRKARPQYDRYTYLEKFEYFAVIYGILLMGLSGFVLWFPDVAAWIMPRWVIDMFRIAHSNEALVCLFALIIGHFFWVHFNPDAFPTSSVWYNGKISKQHLQEEHPLEYARLAELYGETGDNGDNLHAEQVKPPKGRLFMLVELLIYVAFVIVLLATFIPALLA